MKFKKMSFLLMLGLLIIIAGCGSVSGDAKTETDLKEKKVKEVEIEKIETGLNEISLKQAEKMLDDKKSFLLLTFAIDEDVLKESKAIESMDAGLKSRNSTGFYVNLTDEKDENIRSLESKYRHPTFSEWNASEDGLNIVKEGLVTDDAYISFNEYSMKNSLSNGYVYETEGYGSEDYQPFEYFDFADEIDYLVHELEHYRINLDY